ncbi:hypothetical protein BaRGS_00030129 [Batillaria attramentaria]|uniref:Uncharacterized protein n=1 Tax=Batillaria attramentaria TaxID=370345 RepID=A0ABD0JU78_9CAEN
MQTRSLCVYGVQQNTSVPPGIHVSHANQGQILGQDWFVDIVSQCLRTRKPVWVSSKFQYLFMLQVMRRNAVDIIRPSFASSSKLVMTPKTLQDEEINNSLSLYIPKTWRTFA